MTSFTDRCLFHHAVHDFGEYQIYFGTQYSRIWREHHHPKIKIIVPSKGAIANIYSYCADNYKQSFTLQETQTCILAANQPHEVEWLSAGEILVVYLAPELLERLAQGETACNPRSRIKYPVSDDPLMRAIAQRVKVEIGNPATEDFYLNALIDLLAVHLVKVYFSVPEVMLNSSSEGLPASELRQILRYIDLHLIEDICLDDLACHLNLSRYYFSRLFKQSVGLPPHQYIIQQRVKLAKTLLANPALSITEVAHYCGFSSQSHLTKHFKQQTGLTPKRYRDRGQSTLEIVKSQHYEA